MKSKFPGMGVTYIGLDVAVIFGNSSIVVSGLLLMPITLLIAFSLPEINFLPLGNLINMIVAISMVVVATIGNVIRSVIIGIPIIIGNLYIASSMATLLTDISNKFNISYQGYDGMITSFLDGGNILRFWILKLFQGN